MHALFARKQSDKCSDPGANCPDQTDSISRATHRLKRGVQCTGRPPIAPAVPSPATAVAAAARVHRKTTPLGDTPSPGSTCAIGAHTDRVRPNPLQSCTNFGDSDFGSEVSCHSRRFLASEDRIVDNPGVMGSRRIRLRYASHSLWRR
jgi:hypothetical protein